MRGKMKNLKLILIGVFVLFLLGMTAYISSTITAKAKDKYYREANIAEQKKALIESNRKIQKGLMENEEYFLAIIDSMEEYHNNNPIVIITEPPKKDDDIPQVDEYIEFLPDPGPTVREALMFESRTVSTFYRYFDKQNDYLLDLKIKYGYKDKKFEIIPENVVFVPTIQKKYVFASGIYLTSRKSIGSWIDYDVWIFRLGVGVGVNKEFEVDGMGKLGVRF